MNRVNSKYLSRLIGEINLYQIVILLQLDH